MKKFLHENVFLVFAFVLPVAFVVIVGLSVYIPSSRLSTDYDFVYATCGQGFIRYPYLCGEYLGLRYDFEDGVLVEKEVDINPNPAAYEFELRAKGGFSSRLFLYDTETDTSREISLEEAQRLALNRNMTLPDGIMVEYKYGSGIDVFPFINSRSSGGYYMTKGKARRKLNIVNSSGSYNYRNNFYFIGWVIPTSN